MLSELQGGLTEGMPACLLACPAYSMLNVPYEPGI